MQQVTAAERDRRLLEGGPSAINDFYDRQRYNQLTMSAEQYRAWEQRMLERNRYLPSLFPSGATSISRAYTSEDQAIVAGWIDLLNNGQYGMLAIGPGGPGETGLFVAGGFAKISIPPVRIQIEVPPNEPSPLGPRGGIPRWPTRDPGESQLVFDRYGTLRDSLAPGQAHHLNQNGAYGGVIPQNEGVSIKLVGDAIFGPGSPHYETHDIMEGFWDMYRRASGARPQGMMLGQWPTNSQYNRALYNSLQEGAGLTPAEALQGVREAKAQQLQYGLHGWQPVPNVPNPLNQQGGKPRW